MDDTKILEIEKELERQRIAIANIFDTLKQFVNYTKINNQNMDKIGAAITELETSSERLKKELASIKSNSIIF
jgi:septal ring factor EnvC (AmiA/AmiB activator)